MVDSSSTIGQWSGGSKKNSSIPAGMWYFRFCTHPRISLKWKILPLQAIGESTLPSGLKTCFLTSHELQRLETVDKRQLRRILGREGYGKVSKYHNSRSGYSEDDIMKHTGVRSVRASLTLRRLRWICSLLFREKKEGPRSVPLLPALLGTRNDLPMASVGHRCHQNFAPRDSGTGKLTDSAPLLLRAME